MTTTPTDSGSMLSTTPLTGEQLEAYIAAEPINPAGLPRPYEHGGRLTPEGTTVDPHALQRLCGVGQAHCFIVDTWSFASVADFLEDTARRTSTPLTLTREQVMATTCAFNAAAVLTLSAPTMPSWVVPH